MFSQVLFNIEEVGASLYRLKHCGNYKLALVPLHRFYHLLYSFLVIENDEILLLAMVDTYHLFRCDPPE